MTQPNAVDAGHLKKSKLPRRDWILLPILGIATVLLLLSAAEVVGGCMFTSSMTGSCMVFDDPTTGARGVPNSTCWQKGRESHLAEYKFDSCGHRAGLECGPKLPGTYRIVMVGSSLSFGMFIPEDKSIAAILPEELSRKTGRRVEVYNASIMEFGHLRTFDLQMNEVLAAQPDLILFVLAPSDIRAADYLIPDLQKLESNDRNLLRKVIDLFTSESPARLGGRHFTTFITALHFLYQSQSLYVKASLRDDDSTGFMKTDPTESWRNSSRKSDFYITNINNQAKSAGVPVAASLIPSRAQAAMLSMGEWPPGYDPFKLDRELRTAFTRNGATYIDVLPDYETIPNPEQGYFPVDGHPNEEGDAVIASFLAKELTGGAIPALRASSQQASSRGEP